MYVAVGLGDVKGDDVLFFLKPVATADHVANSLPRLYAEIGRGGLVPEKKILHIGIIDRDGSAGLAVSQRDGVCVDVAEDERIDQEIFVIEGEYG